jgi:hypothetical protein
VLHLPMLPSKVRRNLALVRAYAERWRGLAAWAPRSRLTGPLSVVPYRGEIDHGHSYLDTGEIVVRVSDDLAESLATVLHEMAHVAAYPFEESPHHGPLWAERYIAATAEVTRCSPRELRHWLQTYCGGVAGIDPAMAQTLWTVGLG